MPLFSTTTEEKINLQLARVSPLPTLRLPLLALALIGVFAVLIGAPQAARAGVAGQQEVWEDLEFGLAPGQVFDPVQAGVDPVDGSVYTMGYNPAFTEAKIDKFSASGQPEGSISLLRAAQDPDAEGTRKFVGIAVDDALHRFYVVQSESGLETIEPEAKVATKILVFSTVPNSSHQLVEEAPITLPPANEPETIFYPDEVHVDPTNHDLVLSATALDEASQLIRVTDAGVVEPGRYEETGGTLHAQSGRLRGEVNFGFDVGSDGTTYIVADSSFNPENPSIEAFTLPPDFQPASGSLALVPLPGFTAAGAAEGWMGEERGLLIMPASAFGDGQGPQVALTTSTDGEETLFWKTGAGERPQEEITIHGFSLQQQATNALYGGGTVAQECSIESRTSSIAATKEGNLVVTEEGEEVAAVSPPPAWGPNVFRFGPGGGECPGPAPSIALKVGATEPGSVAAGTSVTLDAGGTEHEGSTISGLVWTVEKQGGSTETIPVPGPAPSLQSPHVFATEGTYTVRLAITTTAAVGHAGHGFVAKPKKLTVTAAAGGEAPTVTGLSPNHGPAAGGTLVTIAGTNLTNPTEVKFGTVAGTTLTPVSSTELKVTNPSCTAGETVDVTVTTSEGTSPTSSVDHFTCDSAAAAPTVTGLSPSHGPAAGGTLVTIAGTNLTNPTEVKFGTVAGTTLTPVSSTELKVTSPVGTAGGKVDVVVSTAAGDSTSGSADQFGYDQPTHSLAINKVGSGSGTVTCNGAECQNAYAAGSSVQLAATAAAGSTFIGWTGGGCSGTGPCTVVLTANTVVGATFNLASTTPPDNSNTTPSGNNNTPPGNNNTTPPGSGTKTKTPAQLLKEKQQKALQKCKKLKGKAKVQCTKKAKQIGKPKKKSTKKK